MCGGRKHTTENVRIFEQMVQVASTGSRKVRQSHLTGAITVYLCGHKPGSATRYIPAQSPDCRLPRPAYAVAHRNRASGWYH